MSLILAALLFGELVPMERTVAVVEDSPILHSQVMELLSEKGLAPDGEFLEAAGSREYLDALKELVETRLMVQAGIDAGYYPTEEETRELVDRELENSPELAAIDRDRLAAYLADNQAAQVFLGRKVQAAFSAMPMNPETFLAANREMVEEIVMPRRTGWIYLPVLPSGPDHQAAVDEMLQLRSRIMEGESFERLAMEYSDDGSAVNGGYLDTFGPGEMTYAFEDAAFDLAPGELSQPVTTTYGVHLIRVESREEDGRIAASHILRAVQVDSADVLRSEERALEILEEIRSGAMTFQEAAVLYSMDRTSRDRGGDMGVVPLKLLIPEVADAVEDMEQGSVSEPVVLPEAGAVVLVTVREDPGSVDWSDYSARELEGLVQQVIYQETYDSVIDSLRDEIPVVYLIEEEGSV